MPHDEPMNDVTAEATTPTPPASPEPFRLLRARDGRLGGVAGGLAAAAGIDPTLARFAVALGALTGVGLVAYIVAWIVIPREDPAAGRVLRRAPEGMARALRTGLAVLAALGGVRVVGGLFGLLFFPLTVVTGIFGESVHFDPFDGHGVGWRATVGILLIAVGLVALARRRSPAPPASQAGAGSGGPLVPAPPATPLVDTPAPPGEWRLLAVRVFAWLLLLWFLGGLAGAIVFWGTGAIDLRLPVLVGLAAAGALATLLVALLRTRRPGLILGAAATLLVPVALGAALARWEGEVGDRELRPTAARDLASSYRHLAGRLHLNLSDLRFPPGESQEVRARIGVGHLLVTIPWDAGVVVKGRVGVGELDLLGNVDRGGFGVRSSARSDGEPGGAVFDLTLRAGVGQVEVVRAFTPAGTPEPAPAPPTPPMPPGSYLCDIPPGGGPAQCRPV